MARCCPGAGGPCRGTNRFFSREARRYSRRFARKGPEAIQRRLIEALTDGGISGATILEIGCGQGDLLRRLLEAGASRAVGIDIATGMIVEGRARTRDAGLEDRLTLLAGDAVARAPELDPADVVVLDKVLCCYPNLDAMLETTLPRARRFYAVVVPRTQLIVQAVWRFGIGLLKLLNSSFHPFFHEWPATRRRIAAAGFEPFTTAETIAWRLDVYRATVPEKTAGATGSVATRIGS